MFAIIGRRYMIPLYDFYDAVCNGGLLNPPRNFLILPVFYKPLHINSHTNFYNKTYVRFHHSIYELNFECF
jgi:hypothetical protein